MYTARMKIVFFGTPDFAVPTLERLMASRHSVALVVSRPDRPVGRRQVVTPPPGRRKGATARPRHPAAEEPQISEEVERALAEIEADAVVVVAYGKLIPTSLLEIPRHGFINLHPSLLPRHRGPSPIQWALVCGDRATGVTTMQLDERHGRRSDPAPDIGSRSRIGRPPSCWLRGSPSSARILWSKPSTSSRMDP